MRGVTSVRGLRLKSVDVPAERAFLLLTLLVSIFVSHVFRKQF